MDSGLISIRYAKALLDFAVDQNQQREVYRQAKMLSRVFEHVPHIRFVLANPLIPLSEKKKAVVMAFGEQTLPVWDKMIDLIFKNNREEWLQYIALRYIDLYREVYNIHYGQLITAVPADSETQQQLKMLIEEKIGGRVELEAMTDPEITGGFILQVEDYRWDASVAGQLNRIRKKFKQINKQIV